MIQEIVEDYVQMDEQIKKVEATLAEMRKKRKHQEGKVVEAMKTQNVEEVSASNGAKFKMARKLLKKKATE